LTREELERAIGTYGPTLLLHPDEKYNNTSVEYFLQHATLVSKRGAEIPHPTVDQLPQSGDPGEYWLRLDLEAAKAGDFTAAKAYVRAHWVPGQTYTDLQFWLFSAYNGPGSAHINGLVFNKIVHSGDVVLEPLGEHFGDWECIVVRIDHQSKEMSGVWLSQHAKGRFYTRDEIYSNFKLLRATHPIVYSSLNGHANYASPGLNPSEYHKVPPGGIPAGIEFELRNDTAEGGRILDCSQKYELISADFLTGADAIREPKWVTYPFRWGPEGTATHMSPHDVGEILRAAFGERVPEGVVKVVDELAALVLPYFVKDDLNGAEAPQTHDAWRGSY
ncbi:vacuolar protein sorting-associated protein 62, partial [Fimicolochytrium jonesii]|uniref:vacuolar protein sorting-associated protein 62 n=1 Tax=Fimicolochytrium jonesii TaxID=1396493 RepID=UPI0022FDFD90